METTQYIATSHRSALNRQMNVIADNLANMNTTAYRGEKMIFQEYLQETQDGPGGKLSFVEDTTTYRRPEQGPLEQTGNTLDVGIEGEGFFAVQTEDGERYTRAGNFTVNADNELVTDQGNPVLDENGDAIQLPADGANVEITKQGSIRTPDGEVAQLDLVSFEEPENLVRHAGELYEAGEDQEPQVADDATVHQGMLEGSNVQSIKEMTKMMELMRSQQNAAKLAKQDHEMMLRAIRSLPGSN